MRVALGLLTCVSQLHLSTVVGATNTNMGIASRDTIVRHWRGSAISRLNNTSLTESSQLLHVSLKQILSTSTARRRAGAFRRSRKRISHIEIEEEYDSNCLLATPKQLARHFMYAAQRPLHTVRALIENHFQNRHQYHHTTITEYQTTPSSS